MSLRPLPYHCDVQRYLEDEEPALWSWFSSDEFGESYADAIRLELLKATYRIDRQTHGALYESASEVATALELDAPITLYQAEGAVQMNAGLCFIPGEVHVALHGPILQALTEAERKALLGHELAHYRLWSEDDGAHFTAGRLVDAIAMNPRARPSHHETAIRHQLYTEIYADRGALAVTGDLHAVISCLVKVATGLAEVNPVAYLEQANEILSSKAKVTSEGYSHPETFIRARALQLVAEGGDIDAQLRPLVQGPTRFDRLDLLDQQTLAGFTRKLIDLLLSRTACSSEALVAHAKSFFPDYVAPEAELDTTEPLKKTVSSLDDKTREYAAYVLLDFATADPSLNDVSVSNAVVLARDIGLDAAFSKVYRKELKLTKAKYDDLAARADSIIAQAVDSAEASA